MKESALFVLILIGICTSAMALSCLPCGTYQCPPLPKHCPAGIVKDACDCCDVCAKAENEICGGPSNIKGKCGRGLKCERGSVHAVGVCRKA